MLTIRDIARLYIYFFFVSAFTETFFHSSGRIYGTKKNGGICDYSYAQVYQQRYKQILIIQHNEKKKKKNSHRRQLNFVINERSSRREIFLWLQAS